MLPNNEFTVTCNVGLKMCGNEEIAKSVQDTYNPKDSIMSPGAIRSSSSSKKGYLNSTGASRNPS